MFGFTIIPTWRLKSLKEDCRQYQNDYEEVLKKYMMADRDCDSLREQLNAKFNEVADLKLKLEEARAFPRDIVDLHVLHESDYKCEACKLESPHCRKLTFADRTICVVPKEFVNSFRKKKQPKTKKQS